MLSEDGEQTRDFSFVEDITYTKCSPLETDKLDGLPVNVGSGHIWRTDSRNRRAAIGYYLKMDDSRPRSTANFGPAKCAILPARALSLDRRLQAKCRCERRYRPLYRLDPDPIRHSRLLQRSERNFEEQGNRSSSGEMNIATGIPNFNAAVVDHARKDFPLLDANMTVGRHSPERIRCEGGHG